MKTIMSTFVERYISLVTTPLPTENSSVGDRKFHSCTRDKILTEHETACELFWVGP